MVSRHFASFSRQRIGGMQTKAHFPRSRNALFSCMLNISLTLVASACVFGNANGKDPVPDATTQSETLSLLRELYKEDWEAAKHQKQKLELGKTLYEAGLNTSDDSVSRFILLRVAKDIAAQNGDAVSALAVVDKMQEIYTLDLVASKRDVLVELSKSATSPQTLKLVAATALTAAGEAVAAENSSLASELAVIALATARRAKDNPSIQQAVKVKKEVDELVAQASALQASVDKLSDDPKNPEANLVVGKHFCFKKGDWKVGLGHLSLGSDEDLRQLASIELEMPTEVDPRLQLADKWWELAERSTDPSFTLAMRVRAGFHYEAVFDDLSGLVRTRVSKRLAEIPLDQTKHLGRQVTTAEIEPSTVDAFDISQGTKIIRHSPAHDAFRCENMLGGTNRPVPPGGRELQGIPPQNDDLVFTDSSGPIHFVEFETAKPIKLRRLVLITNHDGNDYSNRGFKRFTLYVQDPKSKRFDQVVFVLRPGNPYASTQASENMVVRRGKDSELSISATFPPVKGQVFRAEFEEVGGSIIRGPRVTELDGFE